MHQYMLINSNMSHNPLHHRRCGVSLLNSEAACAVSIFFFNKTNLQIGYCKLKRP